VALGTLAAETPLPLWLARTGGRTTAKKGSHESCGGGRTRYCKAA